MPLVNIHPAACHPPLTSLRPMSNLRPSEDKSTPASPISDIMRASMPSPPAEPTAPRGGITATRVIDGRNPPALARRGPSPSPDGDFLLCLHDTHPCAAGGCSPQKRVVEKGCWPDVCLTFANLHSRHTYTHIHMQVGSCSCCTRQWSPLVSIHRAPSFFDCYVRP